VFSSLTKPEDHYSSLSAVLATLSWDSQFSSLRASFGFGAMVQAIVVG
jgi:hypothetical protein